MSSFKPAGYLLGRPINLQLAATAVATARIGPPAYQRFRRRARAQALFRQSRRRHQAVIPADFRLTVEGERPSNPAIERLRSMAAMPLDISSRSEASAPIANDAESWTIPPCRTPGNKIDEEVFPNARPDALSDCRAATIP